MRNWPGVLRVIEGAFNNSEPGQQGHKVLVEAYVNDTVMLDGKPLENRVCTEILFPELNTQHLSASMKRSNFGSEKLHSPLEK